MEEEDNNPQTDPQPKAKGLSSLALVSQAWLVILLAIVYGAGLAFIHTALSPKIAENKLNESLKVIPEMLAGAEMSATEEMILEDSTGRATRVFRAFSGEGIPVGWVIPGSGQGFADKIELLVALDNGFTTIRGIYVLEQKETPGLGNFIADPPFEGQFAGKRADAPVTVTTTEVTDPQHQIQALTGATISSDSVASIVNDAIARLRPAALSTGAGGIGANL